MHTTKLVAAVCFLAALLSYTHLHANKTSVTIDCPDHAAAGTEMIIRVNVAHNGNNFLHYTDLVQVSVNGSEIAKWTFSAFSRPEAGNFSREIKYRVTAPGEITATGNCNIHGSAGTATRRITAP